MRFVTDSLYVAIHAKMDKTAKLSHFPVTGTIGFASMAMALEKLFRDNHLLD